MSPEKYLITHALSVGYINKKGENRLFDKLGLSLSPGELICFMGPNGAGKSTLIRTLAGLQDPISGSVEIRSANAETPAGGKIAVVLTDPLQSVNLTAEELVTYGRYPYLGWNIRLSETDKNAIDSAIERVGVAHLRNRKIYELSDGQLQMVMIARAIAQDTPLILLDEPTAHLDLNNRLEMMNLLRDLTRKNGKAILVATHELDLALQTADRIWLAGKKGNILTGLPEDLVLNGAFDEIFEFKGFDLKTGKVLHETHRQTPLQLIGNGPSYLWTRNALERNGFIVTDEKQDIVITVTGGEIPTWRFRADDIEKEAPSVEILLNSLNKRLR